MAVLSDKKIVGGPFANSSELVEVIYDFAVDGGTIADYDVLVADGSCIVEFKYAIFETAGTSGGSLVADLGKAAAGVEFFDGTAVAAMTINSIHEATNSNYVELTDGEKIVFGIEVAAATAGRMHMVFEVRKLPY